MEEEELAALARDAAAAFFFAPTAGGITETPAPTPTATPSPLPAARFFLLFLATIVGLDDAALAAANESAAIRSAIAMASESSDER